jgi:hypothetical protein
VGFDSPPCKRSLARAGLPVFRHFCHRDFNDWRMPAGLQDRAPGSGWEVGRSIRPSDPQGCEVAQKPSCQPSSPGMKGECSLLDYRDRMASSTRWSACGEMVSGIVCRQTGRTNACRTTLVVAVRIRPTDRKVRRESCSHLSSDLRCQRRMQAGLQVDAAPDRVAERRGGSKPPFVLNEVAETSSRKPLPIARFG